MDIDQAKWFLQVFAEFSCFALSAGHEASHASGCPTTENVAPVRVARLMNGC